MLLTVQKIITYALGEHDPGSAQNGRTSNDFCTLQPHSMFLTWTIRTAGPSAFSTSTCLSSWSSPPPPNTPVLTGGNKILSKKFKPPSPHILEEYIYIYIHNMQFTNTFGQSCLLSLQVKPPFHFLSDAFQWMSRSSKIKTSEASQNIFFFDYF